MALTSLWKMHRTAIKTGLPQRPPAGRLEQSSNTTLRAASDLRNPMEQERQRK